MCRQLLNQNKFLKSASKNALFLRLFRRFCAQILKYDLYIPVLRAEPPYTHKKITIFRSTLNCFLALFLSLGANSAFALSTDSQQDMEIEADTAELDDLKGITIYRGDVVVIQGSMRITGHTLTVHFDDNDDMELAIMQGTPATYRQLPDNSEVYDEAEALQMEYYALKDYIILIDKALVIKDDGSRMTGSRIEYDTVLSQVKARGTKTIKSKQGESNEKKSDGRVKITIKKKKEKQ